MINQREKFRQTKWKIGSRERRSQTDKEMRYYRLEGHTEGNDKQSEKVTNRQRNQIANRQRNQIANRQRNQIANSEKFRQTKK